MLLITPPFTQLNTPYPATAYLKGYFDKLGIETHQLDLGIKTLIQLFSRPGLTKLFALIKAGSFELTPNIKRIIYLEESYLSTITPIISFLQNKNATLAYSIVERGFLPEASRFEALDDLEWAFGNLGIQDKARHLATMYLEDISDLIQQTVDPHFGFSRYAEKLSLSATSFDPLYAALKKPQSLVDELMLDILDDNIKKHDPKLICISVPFPGNLYSALRCGKHIKEKYSNIKIAIGGGYPNTELRSITEKRIFEFIDYITLDDGEMPLQILFDQIKENSNQFDLKRTFVYKGNNVAYIDTRKDEDVPFNEVGTPNYEGLKLDEYLSVIELTNPMHRLWSDGRWNKLTMAHGCYWKQCTFCDISLSYIKNYDPIHASLICDRMEEQIKQTNETGFHFVDEAAPPALMRDVALEILKRKMKVSWWTNIRFEKRFTSDLCLLLKASGCIAVSGGLEVASDRLLEKIKKGVTVSQVAQVADNFTQSGIMVHAYLMYGFPTQTTQETIDSLEMVRQMFEMGIIQSGFWHRFSMTAHSPIGLNPDEYNVSRTPNNESTFAHNDLIHTDPTGTNHQLFSEGLKKSLYNYMHGTCFDFELQEWFEFEIPETQIPSHFIEMELQKNTPQISPSAKLAWLSSLPTKGILRGKKKDKKNIRINLSFHTNTEEIILTLESIYGEWVYSLLNSLVTNPKQLTLLHIQKDFKDKTGKDFNKFSKSETWRKLCNNGLLFV